MKTGIAIVIVIFALVLPAQQVDAQSATPVATECEPELSFPPPTFRRFRRSLRQPAHRELRKELRCNSSFVTHKRPINSGQRRSPLPKLKPGHSLAACISDGDTTAVSELTSAEYRGDLYGGGERLSVEEYVEIVNEAPPVPTRIVSVSNVEFNGIRTVRAEVTLVRGNQLLLEQWTFLFRDDTGVDGTPVAANQGHWRAHRIVPLGMPDLPDSAKIDVSLDEYVIRAGS